MTEPSRRPAPAVTPESEHYWQAAAEHRLLLGRNRVDGRLHHPPQAVCPFTWTPADTVEASGRGVVNSFTIVHQTSVKAFKDRLPYVVGYIELDEGVFMVSNIEGCAPGDIHVGMKVEVTFDVLSESIGVPVFVPRRS